VAGLALVVAVIALNGMGRIWWCKQGDLSPISTDIWSAHNSQHLFDHYTFTHVLHGFLFYFLIWIVLRDRWPRWRFTIAIAIESAWEVAENTNAIIEKYRESTISLDYNGDSIANSIADVLSCAVGYALASTMPVWASVTFFFGTELVLALWIRDSLLLNIVMLTYPIDAIKQWQSGMMPPDMKS
jgi:hypothetical protein